MSMSDPIAAMLTGIRNAQAAAREVVELPFSKMKGEISRILKKEGFIVDYVVEGGMKKTLRIYLKYDSEHTPVIRGLKRESKPGLRKYVPGTDVPRVLGGLGVAILTTSAGLMTGAEAAKKGTGGEVLCSVW